MRMMERGKVGEDDDHLPGFYTLCLAILRVSFGG